MPSVYSHPRQTAHAENPMYQKAIRKIINGEGRVGLNLEKLQKGVYSIRAKDESRLILVPKKVNGEQAWIWVMTLPHHEYQKLQQMPPSWFRGLKEIQLSAPAVPIAETSSTMSAESSSAPQTIEFKPSAPILLYDQEWFLLSEAQTEVCRLSLPATVHGAPGAGKSCVAFARLIQMVESLPKTGGEPKRLAYITQSLTLVQEMQQHWESLLALGLIQLPENCQVEFKTTQAVAMENTDKGLAFFAQPEASIKASVLSRLEAEQAKYNKNPNNKKNLLTQSLEEQYQEVRAMSGYSSLDEYEKAVGKHTLFPNAQHRKWLWDQKMALLVDVTSTQDFSPPYDFIALDETQDLWRLEIKLLSKLVKHEQILYSVGDHQSLHDSEFVVPFLKSLHWKNPQFSHKPLVAVYRCPPKVCKAANVVLNLNKQITGDLRYQVNHIQASEETQDSQGDVFWLNSDKDLQKILSASQPGGLFAAILPKSFDEAKKQATLQTAFAGKRVLTLAQFQALLTQPDSAEKTQQIQSIEGLAFTPAEIKGLGFKNVFIYQPLQHDARFEEANKLLQAKSQKTKGSKTMESINPVALRPAFDELFTNLTRTSGNVFIVQAQEQKVALLSQTLKKAIEETSATKTPAGLSEVSEAEKTANLERVQETLKREAEARAQAEYFAKQAQEDAAKQRAAKVEASKAEASSSSAPSKKSSIGGDKKKTTNISSVPKRAAQSVSFFSSSLALNSPNIQIASDQSELSKFFKSIKNNDLKTVKRIVTNQTALLWSKDGYSPLDTASRYGHLDMVKFLFEKNKTFKLNGADLNAQKAHCCSPMELAIEFGHFNVVQFLIENMNIDFTDQNLSKKLFGLAASSGEIKIVKLFAEKLGLQQYSAEVSHFAEEVTKANRVCSAGLLQFPKLPEYLQKKDELINFALSQAELKRHIQIMFYLNELQLGGKKSSNTIPASSSPLLFDAPPALELAASSSVAAAPSTNNEKTDDQASSSSSEEKPKYVM